MLDRVIFGDNQFFGINHWSEDKARAQAERFAELDAITGVIEIAYDCGIRGFMLNANNRAEDICSYLRAHPDRFADFRLYPSIPYPHKYANLVAEKGVLGALTETIRTRSSARGLIKLVEQGGRSLVRKDLVALMKILVDVELQIFRELDTPVLFLQNVVTDLLLGLGSPEIFQAYADHLREKHGIRPGFITMNLPMAVSFLEGCGIEDAVVCSSINQAGYFMNPDIPSYVDALQRTKLSVMAMSVLASGAIPAAEATRWVASLPRIESVVFGASSRGHIDETARLVRAAFDGRTAD